MSKDVLSIKRSKRLRSEKVNRVRVVDGCVASDPGTLPVDGPHRGLVYGFFIDKWPEII